MLGNKQVIISLITAFLIVFFIAMMSEKPGYTLNVTAFLAATPSSDKEYRIYGFVRLLDNPRTFQLCDEQNACIPVTLSDETMMMPAADKKLVVFGTWQNDVLNAHDLITPCHEDIR